MTINWIDDPSLDVEGKTVFCRVDFNVPLDDDQQIVDDSRIVATLPTINLLLDKGAKVVLASHLGRPKGKLKSALSLEPVAVRVQKLLNRDVIFVEDCVGDGVRRLAKDLPSKGVMVLENLRFHSGEEKNERNFSAMLAYGMDMYVNDAFGCAHRAHASTEGITHYLKECAGGLLMRQEVTCLDALRLRPQKPFILILGGAKVSDKLGILTNLLPKANKILIGGAMAYTFLRALGESVGASKIEQDRLMVAKGILSRAAQNDVEVILPVDHVVAKEFSSNAPVRVIDTGGFESDDIGLDIGPKTSEIFASAIPSDGTIFWNGTPGVYEWESCSRGTTAIGNAVAEFRGFSVAGGGDTVAALSRLGLKDKISYISTGGGASMEFLEGIKLPALKAIGYWG